MNFPVNLRQSRSPVHSLGSSEEILSTMEERQRRLLEADDSTMEPPASTRGKGLQEQILPPRRVRGHRAKRFFSQRLNKKEDAFCDKHLIVLLGCSFGTFL